MNIFDRIINDTRLQVKLILPAKSGVKPDGSNVIKGYLENPFSFSNEGNWSDSLFGRGYSTKANEWLARLGSDIQILNHLDTTQQWTGANIPTFNLSFYIISTNASVQPTEIVSKLYQAIYPEQSTLGGTPTAVKYHWGYQPNTIVQYGNNIGVNRVPIKGTVILSIGTWFRAINLVIKSFVPEYSTTLNPTGRPYWVKLTVALSPNRLPYYDEMQAMFTQTPNTKVITNQSTTASIITKGLESWKGSQ